MKSVVLYATDTMADWEYGYLVAGLAMAEEAVPGRFRLVVASDGPVDQVTTMGGMRVRPDVQLSDVDPEDITALILPGANNWADGHEAALRLAGSLLRAGVPVAAICGGTLGLARAGLLNDRPHTSNAREYLQGAREYSGAEHYRDENAVTDGDLITAPATSPIDFARAVFERLEALPQPVIDAWYGLYTTGDKKYFDQLIGASA